MCLCGFGPTLASGATLYGFNYDPRGYGSNGDRGLDLIHQAGANTIRVVISWDSLEPTAPKNGQVQTDPGYVSQLDSLLQTAAARGIRVIAVLLYTPCWASSAPDDQRAPCVSGAHSSDYQGYAPNNVGDYAAIAAWVAARWGSQLAALEIWNEPNYTRFFYVNDPAASTDRDTLWVYDPQDPAHYSVEATDEARVYTQLLQAAYPAVKAQAPRLPVLGGVLAYAAQGFLHRLYADGIRGYFDGLSIHPYDNQPVYQATGNQMVTFAQGVPLVRREMLSDGDRSKQLWLTEFGWPTCAPNVMDWCVSEAQQASKLTAAFQLLSTWNYLGAAVIYCLVDPGTDPNNFEDNLGLLRYDWSPKPAWDAFVQAMAEINGQQTHAVVTPPPVQTHTAPTPRWPKVKVARIVRVDSRHLLLSLVCKARRACRSTIKVFSAGPHRIKLATLHVRLAPGSKAKRKITLPVWLGGKPVHVVVIATPMPGQGALASDGAALIG